jgi:hypothetical protein
MCITESWRAMSIKIPVSCLLLIVLVGCAQGTLAPTFPSAVASPVQSPLAGESPLPLEPSEYALPTPATPAQGVVGGVILRETAGQPLQPLSSGALFLSSIHMQDGKPVMAVVDEEKAPKTVADSRGLFRFTGVAPGTYTLVYKAPAGTYVLREPGSGEDLIIEVEGGKVVDLGVLRYGMPY